MSRFSPTVPAVPPGTREDQGRVGKVGTAATAAMPVAASGFSSSAWPVTAGPVAVGEAEAADGPVERAATVETPATVAIAGS
jgi:hypothetical protein